MTELSLTKTSLADLKVDALLVGVSTRAGALELAPGASDVDKALKKKLLATLESLGTTGRAGEVTKLPTLGALDAPTVVAVGLGEAPEHDGYAEEVLRRGTGAAIRALAGTARVATSLPEAGTDRTSALRAVAEGAVLGGYAFTAYRSPASSDATKPPVDSVTIVVDNPRDKGAKQVVTDAQILRDAVRLARDLVNTPACDLHPADLARAAERACGNVGCRI